MYIGFVGGIRRRLTLILLQTMTMDSRVRISVDLEQLEMLLQGMRSVKGYEIDDAVKFSELHSLLTQEAERLKAHAKGLPYIDPAMFRG